MKRLLKYLNENHSDVRGNAKFSNHSNELWTKINIQQSTSNLLTVVDILEKFEIKYSVVFGTLLGIYRDGKLIEHDTDTDLAIWLENENKLIEAIKKIEERKIRVTRFDQNMISFTCGGDYIDLYLYKKKEKESNVLECIHRFGTLTTMDFSKTNTINFKGRNLACVYEPEEYFEKLYGNDWKTPIKNKHANINNGNR